MPHNRGTVRLETWLSKLLWLLATKNGGEVRIPAVDVEDAPDRCGVVTEYDKVSHELRIIAVSGLAEMIVINTEQQWARTQTPDQTSTPSPRPLPNSTPTDSSRSSVHTDEDLASIEQRLLQRAAERKRQREAEEMARAQRQ